MTDARQTHQEIVKTPDEGNQSVVLRLPKPDLQTILLGLVALITIFQTIQLLRLGSVAGSQTSKNTVPSSQSAPRNTSSGSSKTGGSSGTGIDTEVPQSMVGGC